MSSLNIIDWVRNRREKRRKHAIVIASLLLVINASNLIMRYYESPAKQLSQATALARHQLQQLLHQQQQRQQQHLRYQQFKQAQRPWNMVAQLSQQQWPQPLIALRLDTKQLQLTLPLAPTVSVQQQWQQGLSKWLPDAIWQISQPNDKVRILRWLFNDAQSRG